MSGHLCPVTLVPAVGYSWYMILVQRRDNVSLKALNLTDEGYLDTRGTVARVGILTYYVDGKPFRELVPAETLFNQASLDTLPAKPVTNRHPGQLTVDAKNAGQVMKGITLPPVQKVADGEDELLDCGVKVMDADTINDIKAGVVELSLGYQAQLDMTPGTWRGERYDAVQTKRVYNHLAVVPAARAGHKARLRLDAAHNMIEEEGMELVKIKIDGRDVEVPKDSAPAIEAALKASAARADAKDGKDDAGLAALRSRLDAAEAELEVLKKEKEKKEGVEAKADEAKRIDALVKERAGLLEKARGVLKADEHAKLDGLDSLGIMTLVAETLDPETKLDGKSEDYVRATFNALLKNRGDGNEGKDDKGERTDFVGDLIVNGPKGSKKADAAGAGVRHITVDEADRLRRKKLGNRWREPLNAKVS
jgi:hypothetical protein